MSETIDETEEVTSETPEPTGKTVWHKVRDWVFAAVLLFLISSVIDATVGFVTGKEPEHGRGETEKSTPDCSKRSSSLAKSLCAGNEYVANSVKAVDPFNFAGIFYRYLISGVPPNPQAFYSFSQPVPKFLEGSGILLLIVFLYRAIPGAIYTAIALASTGLMSSITAFISLLFGYVTVRAIYGKDDESGHRFISYLAIPLIGGAFIWVLLQLMSLASHLFGSFLAAAEASTAFSILGTTVWAIFKKTETDTTEKFIKWSRHLVFK